MRRIPTLPEIERRQVLDTLHLCGNDRSLTAKVLGVLGRALRKKLPRYEDAGFAMPVPLAPNDVGRAIGRGGPIQDRELPENEAATIKVIEELISVVEAIGEPVQPGAAHGGEMTARKEKN